MGQFSIYNTSNNDHIGFGKWRISGDYIDVYNLNNDQIGYAKINGQAIDIFNNNNDRIQYATNDGYPGRKLIYDTNNDAVAYWLW